MAKEKIKDLTKAAFKQVIYQIKSLNLNKNDINVKLLAQKIAQYTFIHTLKKCEKLRICKC